MQTFKTIALIALSITVSVVDALPSATCVSNFVRPFDNPTTASFTITSSFPEPAAFMYATLDILGTARLTCKPAPEPSCCEGDWYDAWTWFDQGYQDP